MARARAAADPIRVIHTVPRVHGTASGPSYSIPSLCQSLADAGVETTLHTLAPSHFPADARFACIEHAAWPMLRRLGISPAMCRALREAAPTVHIIHNHSFWMLPNVYPHWAARKSGCRLVHSPRGTLSSVALRFSRLRKRVFWWLGQGGAARAADCFHATSESEYRDIRRHGLRGPVAVIPNGIHLPRLRRDDGRRRDGARRLLFLARVHPIKGVDVLLRAWCCVQGDFPEWELHIVGPADSPEYEQTIQGLARDLKVRRVVFAGPAYAEAKTDAYFQSELYVLPTHSENFGISVAEALAHGLPVITTRGAPWSGLEPHGCGWWIERGEAALTSTLREALALSPETLRQLGGRGRMWMQREFSWPSVARMMRDTYSWLIGGGPPPDWVQVD